MSIVGRQFYFGILGRRTGPGAYRRVFGVFINGEHRAYPHRILNAHEMANDVVGGVPFALAIDPSAVLESCIPPT